MMTCHSKEKEMNKEQILYENAVEAIKKINNPPRYKGMKPRILLSEELDLLLDVETLTRITQERDAL